MAEIENRMPHHREGIPAAARPVVPHRGRGAAAAARPVQRNDRWRPPNNADPERRRQLIGEKIYLLVFGEHPRLAGKITGMLLEGLESEELICIVNLETDIRHYIEMSISAMTRNLVAAGASAQEALELIDAAAGDKQLETWTTYFAEFLIVAGNYDHAMAAWRQRQVCSGGSAAHEQFFTRACKQVAAAFEDSISLLPRHVEVILMKEAER